MSLLNSFGVLLNLLLIICTFSSVSSDCSSCCNYGTGCSTAYQGGWGKCCQASYLTFCCPSGSTCGSYGLCENYLYWGSLTLAGLIGVIVASIIGFIVLITVCTLIFRRRRRVIIAQTMSVPKAVYNPGLQPPPYPYMSQAQY